MKPLTLKTRYKYKYVTRNETNDQKLIKALYKENNVLHKWYNPPINETNDL